MSESIAAPVVGVGAVVWKGDKLLLVRRGHAPRAGSWSLPGGRQQSGETVYQAAAREIREETGVEIRILGIADVVDLIERRADGGVAHHYTVIDMAAEWAGGEARAGDDAAEVAWATRADLARYDLTPKVLEVIELAARKRTQPQS